MPVIQIALRTDKELDAVKRFIDSKAYGGWAVREISSGENEHWHWLIEADVRNVQAFRVALTRAVESLKGNGAYSASVVKDLEKYERYMAKGEAHGVLPEIAWRNSLKYDDDKVAELHEEYWSEHAKLKKRKAGSMIDHVVDEAKRQNVEWKNREKLGALYVEEVVRRARPLNIFAARAAVNTIQCLLCGNEEAVEMFKVQI